MEANEEVIFRDYLSGEGLRFTLERRLILEEVFRNHDHFEAEEIAIGLRQRGKRVSRASVYRTLHLLTGSGLLRVVHSEEKHSHYEHVLGHEHHDHLFCTSCGRIIEFFDDGLEELQLRCCTRHGFMPKSHELRIVGVCAECISNASTSPA